MARCWESHPSYCIQVDEDKYYIQGGSCTGGYPKDVDVFIGFDSNMSQGKRTYPWEQGIDFLYPIVDTQAPKNIIPFKKLLEWTAEQLKEGKHVYCGCIGGHGRTGLFLAALTTYMNGDKDSINTVRNNYCKKAVESGIQVDWLHDHFGIKKVNGSKQFLSSATNNVTSMYGDPNYTNSWVPPDNIIDNKKHKAVSGKVTELSMHRYHAVSGANCFMGR